MPSDTAIDVNDAKAIRDAFVANRRLPSPAEFDEVSLAAARRDAEARYNRARRELFMKRRRILLTEGDPLDGALMLRCLEEFRRSHTTHRSSNTETFSSPVAFRVGARTYGEPNEIFDFKEYLLVKQVADRVTIVADGVRLTFSRTAPRDSRYDSPRWTLESRMFPDGERNGTTTVRATRNRRTHTLKL